jgi:secreted trypsin-like serine protease
MKIMSAATYAGISLLALFGLTAAGHGQAGQVQACKPVDETTGALVARSTESVRDASPEALAAFRALSLNPPRSRIVGGHLTLVTNNPWQIAMIRAVVAEPTRSQFCGGSIIRNDWILTAAHCVKNSIVREDPSRVDVVAGSSQYAIGGERLKVAAIHRHPQYNEQTMDNDFALLRLQTPMTKGQVIQLADANTQLDDGTKICVTGWGATFEGSPGAIDLLGAEVPTVSNTVCNQPESYKGDILASMFCAGLRDGGIDSCQGDSGGPASATLQGRATLVGVVSWGEGCARRLKYGVYSRVSTAAQWIASTIGGSR